VSILLYVNFTLGLAGYATDVAAWQDAKRAGGKTPSNARKGGNANDGLPGLGHFAAASI